MKKILFLMAPILIIVIAFSCSKDHSAPTFAKYAVTSKPINVEATYDPATQKVNVTWNMNNTTNVINYYVVISDSIDIDFGNIILRETNSLERSYSFDDVVKYIPESTSSIILYFTVSALYNIDYNDDNIINNNDLHYFTGPRADNPDSALVVID